MCSVPQDRIEHFDFGVAVDAFVHPRIFEFVGGDHAVPVLVAEFVLHDDFGSVKPSGINQLVLAGDEGGIFHASGGRAGLRIDHGQRLVGIRPVPFLEMVESVARDAFVALDLVPVRGLHQEAELALGPSAPDRCSLCTL